MRLIEHFEIIETVYTLLSNCIRIFCLTFNVFWQEPYLIEISLPNYRCPIQNVLLLTEKMQTTTTNNNIKDNIILLPPANKRNWRVQRNLAHNQHQNHNTWTLCFEQVQFRVRTAAMY